MMWWHLCVQLIPFSPHSEVCTCLQQSEHNPNINNVDIATDAIFFIVSLPYVRIITDNLIDVYDCCSDTKCIFCEKLSICE